MSKAARRLGRGLDSLVSNLREEAPGPAPGGGSAVSIIEESASKSIATAKEQNRTGAMDKTHSPPGATDAAAFLPVDQITPNPFQPRQEFDDAALDGLVKSISRSGVLQPISVRRHGDRFQIIAGERRWRAAKQCNVTTIPVVIRRATDEQMLELALVENLQREDLNAIDRAKAYRQFCRSFNLTAEEVAERLGEDRSTVTNYMRLLELDDALQAMVASGSLTMGHARALLGLRDSHERRRLAEAVEQNQLSVRALEEIIRRRKGPEAETATDKSAPVARSPHLRDLQTRFEHSLKTKVTIHEGRKKGSGRITIEYYSIDDFDRIASALGISLD